MPPPVFRRLVLISTAALLLIAAVGLAAGGAQQATAQSTPTPSIDYDIDNDGLIEVRNKSQLQAIHWDLNGDGTPESRVAFPTVNAQFHGQWANAYPNAMTGAGCPARDHDDDTTTPDQPSCLGYELASDIDASGNDWRMLGKTDERFTGDQFNARLVGNGFRILNPQQEQNQAKVGFFFTIGPRGSVEGVGFVNPRWNPYYSDGGGIAHDLHGKIIGSYIEGGVISNNDSGGFAHRIGARSEYAGLIAHSYTRGFSVGAGNGDIDVGGYAKIIEPAVGNSRVRCLNSYISGPINELRVAQHYLRSGLVAVEYGAGTQSDNCYADTTAESSITWAWQGATAEQTAPFTQTNAQLAGTDGYTGPFAAWDDYDADGDALDAGAPRADFWHFGDETMLPVLKAWHHDYTIPPARSLTGAATVNLCTRTLAVANEIIRHLNDTHVRPGVSPAPTPLSLEPCRSSEDIREATITQLANLVVTNSEVKFNLRPERTFPAAKPLTTLDQNDFAYLTSATHFDLGGNEIETLPPRLFQGIPVRYLDLSGNKLTTLHADTFAGIPNVSITVGNSLLLNDNTLTDTGLPGHVFDSLKHMNAVDLSNNSLTRVNTRWFEKFVHLGKKDTTTPEYTHALGLHLAGNIVTEHYYSHKLASGIKERTASYVDTTDPGPPSVTTSAGDALRDAIVAEITRVAGGTTPTTLALTGTDFYFNAGGTTTGYQASSVTSCLSTQTAAPGRGDYASGLPDCQIQAHWSPPHKSADTATATPTLSSPTGARGTIAVTVSHTSSTTFVAYQVRYRTSATDPWTPWRTVPITLASGSKTLTAAAPESGLAHSVGLRAVSTTGPPSAAATTTTTTTAAAWLSTFTATTVSTAVGALTLAWSISGVATNHTVTGFHYRYKTTTQTTYSDWWAVPDGSDADTNPGNESSYTVTGLPPDATYDVQLVAAIDDADADSDPDFVTAIRSASATPLLIPASLSAAGGTAPGTIRVTWAMQTAAMASTSKFQIRRKLKTDAWPTASPYGWTDVPDDPSAGDPDTDQHDETEHTLTGLSGTSEEYDIQVRLFWDATAGAQPHVAVSGTPTPLAAPASFTATTSTEVQKIDLTWAAQSVTTDSDAKYQYRTQVVGSSGWSDWTDVPDSTGTGGDADSHTYNETGYTITGLHTWRQHNIEVRFTIGTTIGAVARKENVRAGYLPRGAGAQGGTAPGTIDVTWTQQTQYSHNHRRFALRIKRSANQWAAGGYVHPADNDGDGNVYDETSYAFTGLKAGVDHDIEIIFNYGPGEHDWQFAFPQTLYNIEAKAVPTPTGLMTTTSFNQVKLDWDQQTAETGGQAKYQVRSKKSSADWPATSPFGWADVPSSTHATTTHTVTGLEGGTPYDFEVRFHWNNAVETSSAATASATPTAVPTQTGFTATTSLVTRRVDLSWNQQTAHQGSDVKFQVRSKPTSDMTWPTAWTDVPDSPAASGGDAGTHTHDETGYAVTGLDARRPYDFQLRLEIGDAAGPAVEVTNILAGYHPRGLRATTGTIPGSVVLSWDLQTANQAAQAQFSTRHKLKSAATFQLTGDGGWRSFLDQGDAGTDSHDETSYVWTELEAGVEYEFNVNFYDGTAWTPNQYLENVGARAAIVPTPTNFTAATSTTTVNAIDLKWDKQTDSTNSNSKHQYRIKENGASWPSTSTMGWTDIGDGSDADGHTYDESGLTLSSLTAGTLYDVELRFFWTTAVGTSAAVATTATASAIPRPPNFSATSGSVTDTVDLSWDAMSGITKFQYRYKLDSVSTYATSGAGSWMDVPDSSDANAHLYDETSYTVTGLTGNMDYDFELRAHTAANTFGPVATAAAKAQPQSPPTGLTAATGTNPGEIVLGWTAPTGSTHTGFQYRHKRTTQDDSAYSTWDNVPDSGTDGRANETAYTVASLWAGVGYTLQIRAQSASNNSEPGTGSTATATAQVVAAPTNFTATRGTGPGEIDLSWTALASSGLPSTPGTPATPDAVVRYEYRYKLNSATSYPTTGAGTWTQVPDGTDNGNSQADETSYKITGLTAYTSYDVQLRAAIHDNDEGTATTPEYYSASASDTNTRSGLAIPNDPQATGGTDPGEISINWVAQTTFGSTFTDAKYQIRYKLATASFPAASPFGWADISGSNRNTLTTTLSGLMNRQLYDIELRFLPNSSLTSAAAKFQGTPTAVPVPTGLSAAAAMSTAAAIDVDWMAQTDMSGSEAKYQIRRKRTNAAWPTTSTEGWTDIPDSASDGAHNENETTLGALDAGESYNVELRFHWSNAVGASVAASTTANAARIPAPPSFSATSGSVTDTVDLSWGAVSGITKFQYRHRLMGASWPAAAPFGWADVPDGTDTGSSLADETSYTVTGLTGGMTYDFELRAHTAAATFGPSSSDSANAQPQSPPTSYTATTGTNPGEIVLGWTAPAGSTHTGFQYRHKRTGQADSAYIDWADVPDSASDGRSNETSYTITSLWAGVGYTVQIRAQASGNSASEPGASTTATATAKEVAAPTTLNATIGDGPGEIDITWTALATSGLPTGDAVVQYQYRTKLQSASWPTSAPLGWNNIPAANTSSYTITGLTAYTLYDIQLRGAIDDGSDTTGEPPKLANYHSDAVPATGARTGLARPANLRATGGTNPGEIALTWDAQTAITTGFSAAKYQVRSRLATATSWPSGGGWTDIASSGLTTASHTLTDLMNGRQYDVEVRFVPSSSLMSAARSVRGTTTVVAVPAGFTASTAATTAGAIDLTWTAQSATSGSEAKYQYRRKAVSASWPTSGDMGWTDIADSGTDGAHNESSLTFTGLTAGASYHVELRFHWSNAVGASAATATLTARASDVPIPGSFSASSGSDAGEIDLSWSAVTNATYEFRYKLASVSNYPTSGAGYWASAGSGTSYTITGLTARSTYNVQLRAVVAGSNSLPTPTRTAQAQTTPGPANLTFSHGPNPGDIKIDWARPALPAPVTHYEFRYKLATAATYPSSGAGHWAEVPDSGDTGTLQSDETTYTISGLQAGKSYHVQVRVFANQAIQYSLPQLGTQAARPVPPPTSFSASGGTNPGEVDLSWTAPTGVTILRYELRHRLGATGAWSSWTSAGANVTYTYTGLLAGMSRTFELRAVMQTVGASAAVSTTGTPTPVPTPASFTATTGVFPGEVDLSWMAVTGATSYEYRYTLSSNVTWPDEATWQSVAATVTSTTITLLDEGAGYTIELRAAITNVGKSTMVARGTASARGADFTDSDARPNVPAIHAAYAVDAAAIPGRIAIDLPGGTDPFIYRHRTVNPGQWSRWFKVTPQASQNQFLIPDLTPGVEYEIQVRAYTGMATGFTTPLTAEAQAAPLVAAEDFEASESSGVILLQWSSPALYTPDYYEYRTKPTGTQTWSEWTRVDHEGDRGSTQRKWVTGLESGISHDFELRMQTGAGPSPIAKSAGSARLRIAEVHSIRPTVREVSVRVGDTIALTVDIYDGQAVLDNSIPDKEGSKLVFRWEDKLADGNGGSAGGTFATPNNERRVTYTAPSSPGRYIVTAEAQPDGVCTSHHEGAAEITDAERAQCTATFTIRVSGIPAVPAPRPYPVDPTGAIPTSMVDDQGGTYTVFTPTKGGTFTGDDITVTAPAGAIPDRTVVGIGATTSDIPTPDPIPGATMSLAGSYYDINAIADNGEPPIPSYTLNEPATACLPFPQEFRADLSNVVLIQRKSTGDLSILSTKIRSNAGDLTVCGTLTQLPASVAVARLGLVPAPAPTTPSTPADTPDTGATTPGYAVLLLTLLTGALLLTRIGRMRRMIRQ